MNSLQIATTPELITELLSRETFAGIIIKSSKEIKTNNDPLMDWDIYVSNLSPEDTKYLLEQISNSMELPDK